MKKYFITIIVVLTTGLTSIAQVEQGSSFFNFRLGLGNAIKPPSVNLGDYAKNETKVVMPPLTVSYEYGIMENITVEGMLGLFSLKNIQSVEGEKISEDKFNYFFLAGRGNYYFVNEAEYNVYGGVMLGFAHYSLKKDSNSNNNTNISSSGSKTIFGVQVGARYFLSDNFALNAELGYGVNIFSIGISYKFGS